MWQRQQQRRGQGTTAAAAAAAAATGSAMLACHTPRGSLHQQQHTAQGRSECVAAAGWKHWKHWEQGLTLQPTNQQASTRCLLAQDAGSNGSPAARVCHTPFAAWLAAAAWQRQPGPNNPGAIVKATYHTIAQRKQRQRQWLGSCTSTQHPAPSARTCCRHPDHAPTAGCPASPPSTWPCMQPQPSPAQAIANINIKSSPAQGIAAT